MVILTWYSSPELLRYDLEAIREYVNMKLAMENWTDLIINCSYALFIRRVGPIIVKHAFLEFSEFFSVLVQLQFLTYLQRNALFSLVALIHKPIA